MNSPTKQNPADRISEFASQASDRANDLKDKTSDFVSQAGDRAKEMKDKVGELATQAKEKAQEWATEAADELSHAKDKAQEWAVDAAQKTGRGMMELGNEATELVRRYPVPAILIGFGLGFMLARASRK
jgi:ElaB/YqjD/DUF883 family membrane-anchored ribosome-binding protein